MSIRYISTFQPISGVSMILWGTDNTESINTATYFTNSLDYKPFLMSRLQGVV